MAVRPPTLNFKKPATMQPLQQEFKKYLQGKLTHPNQVNLSLKPSSPSTSNLINQHTPKSFNSTNTFPNSSNTTHLKLSASSIRNYSSDINHFLNWLSNSIQEEVIKVDHITPAVINTYRSHLSNTLSDSYLNTANRRLSSLRKFGSFMLWGKLSDINPCLNLINLDTVSNSNSNQPTSTTLKHLLNQFKVNLKSEKLTNSTIKNYLSDVKQYLIWTQTNNKSTNSKSITLS